MMAQASSWWDRLTKKEKEIMIELLYNLTLAEYGVVINEKTNKYVKVN